MDYSKIENSIGYVFKDKKLLKRALTLASYDNNFNNQTLEFLGDAVLEFIVSDVLYDENASEGELTERRKNIVSDAALAPVSLKLGLDGFLMGYDKGNKKAVPSAYEAVAAAIYLDGGVDAAKKFVLGTLEFKPLLQTVNFKGELQEALKSTVRYKTEEIGTERKHRFRSTVELFGEKFVGEGDNKPSAEQQAAQNAYEYLQRGKK